MTVGELRKLLKSFEDYEEIFVAHDNEDGEDIIAIERTNNACFIIYRKEGK